jgi:RNA polymerase sigma factor (sigma-70 family)
MSHTAGDFITNPSIFLRLNRTDQRLRELAWTEFRDRYAPVIAGFARNFGAHQQDVDDVIQQVLLGFFAKSPTFAYDPAKGRFRGYLKTCTCNLLRNLAARRANAMAVPIDQIDPDSIQVEQVWNDLWEDQLIQRSVADVRRELGGGRTFRAFEMYVILDMPAQRVADELGLHVDSVYRAKEQVAAKLRAHLDGIRAEED